MNKRLCLGLFLAAAVLPLAASPSKISVDVNKPGAKVSPELFGIFFEDINLSADGGIYPELVRNRSFEDSEKPVDWKLINGQGAAASEMKTDSSRPLNPMNRQSLRINIKGDLELVNEGYWGMNVVQGDTYRFKMAARSADGFTGPIGVKLIANGKEMAAGSIDKIGNDWKYYTVELAAKGSDPKASLHLYMGGKGTVFLDMVSLLPAKTWKKTGLRPDLAQAMADLKPSFLRFPGGCWVEGTDMAHMYNWKKTVGDVDVRTPLYNIWQYYATHGIGFHEYLQMAEDLGAEPLFCVNVGMSHAEVIPMDRMGQWVQDALDAIEYANGPTNTVWGGLRARNGHPEPFKMKYLEIGNENGREPYAERWPLFVKAIKAKYPEIKLLANDWAGGYPKSPMPEIVDEHYYNTPEWFMRNANHYDNYDRKGPKIFVGEYAVTRNAGLGNLRGAIGEAAFMTGLERNSDIVAMASYAPLFCNANHKRWPVNLINFDSSRWFGIPSYYVQKLFSEHRGDVVLPTTVEQSIEAQPAAAGRAGVGTWNTAAEFKDIKVTAPDGKVLYSSEGITSMDGWTKVEGNWTVQDGALKQSSESENQRALIGDRSWTDYTITLKARKLSGQEGFLILFHVPNDEDRVWWNIGGWNNTQHALELNDTVDGKRGRIETGKWYDIEVELRGESVRCKLDGKVIHDVKNPRMSYSTLFASATRDDDSGDIILKVVNTAAEPRETEITLNGLKQVGETSKVIVLTSASPLDENTLDQPTKVSPKTESVTLTGTTLTRTYPGNSLSIIRIPTRR